MKQTSLACRISFISIALAILLAGCIGVSKSPTPRFYTLQAVAAEKAERKHNNPSNVIIGIGPAKVPEYLNRPQIVTMEENNRLNFAEFDRWGEPLDFALPRVVAANLAILLPKTTIETSPWNLSVPVKYQVIITVTRLESRLDRNLFFAAQWSVIDLETKEMVESGKSSVTKPVEPPDFSGIAAALSAACYSLSADIAERLATLSCQNGKSISAKTQEHY